MSQASFGMIRPAMTPQPLQNPSDVKHTVVLVRPGVGPKKWTVPAGTTVASLMEEAGATMENQDLMIGNDKVNGSHVLQDKAVIFLVPKPKNAY